MGDWPSDMAGHCQRNAGFIRQPHMRLPACRMNPAFRGGAV
jgi:hypothetical protein